MIIEANEVKLSSFKPKKKTYFQLTREERTANYQVQGPSRPRRRAARNAINFIRGTCLAIQVSINLHQGYSKNNTVKELLFVDTNFHGFHKYHCFLGA